MFKYTKDKTVAYCGGNIKNKEPARRLSPIHRDFINSVLFPKKREVDRTECALDFIF